MKHCSVFLYAVIRVQCAPASVYILSTLLLLYGALRAHVRCTRLINTVLHYITYYVVASRTTCKK